MWGDGIAEIVPVTRVPVESQSDYLQILQWSWQTHYWRPCCVLSANGCSAKQYVLQATFARIEIIREELAPCGAAWVWSLVLLPLLCD